MLKAHDHLPGCVRRKWREFVTSWFFWPKKSAGSKQIYRNGLSYCLISCASHIKKALDKQPSHSQFRPFLEEPCSFPTWGPFATLGSFSFLVFLDNACFCFASSRVCVLNHWWDSELQHHWLMLTFGYQAVLSSSGFLKNHVSTTCAWDTGGGCL